MIGGFRYANRRNINCSACKFGFEFLVVLTEFRYKKHLIHRPYLFMYVNKRKITCICHRLSLEFSFNDTKCRFSSHVILMQTQWLWSYAALLCDCNKCLKSQCFMQQNCSIHEELFCSRAMTSLSWLTVVSCLPQSGYDICSCYYLQVNARLGS
jgi:hypothetical protein